MKKDNTSTLTNLGQAGTKYRYENPGTDLLETFENQFPGRDYTTSFVFDEFTSLCLAGETKIDIARNEIEYPDGISIKDLVGTEGYVFSFDYKRNVPVVKKYHSVRKTRENANVVCILLEHLKSNGQGIVSYIPKKLLVTPDHLILISTGWGLFKWIKAKDLKPNMRLIASQQTMDDIRGKLRHRLILEERIGRYLEHTEHGHHIDENHFNNCPENLEIKSQSKHISDHKKELYGWEFLPIQEMVKLYNSGFENFYSLSKKYKCDVSTIESRIGHLVKRRTQSESLLAKEENILLHQIMEECQKHYEKGYTIYELAEYYKVHSTTISEWIIKAGGITRTSLQSKQLRKEVQLEGLNHKVVSVTPAGKMDVYNMEVEETECFFGEGVVLHNCPKTHQPDFAKITVRYIADKLCIETKSLKTYYLAYRQHGSFMETITNQILNDLVSVCKPRFMSVTSNFNARGGTHINVIAEYNQ